MMENDLSWKGPGDQMFETPMKNKASFNISSTLDTPILITSGNLKSVHEMFKVRPVINSL